MSVGCGTVVYSKKDWSNAVLKKAWQIENKTWYDDAILFPDSTLISRIIKYPSYFVWLQLSDTDPKYTRGCEIMVKIICGVSKLRFDNFLLDKAPFSEKVCESCDTFSREDANHIILQCESVSDIRQCMFREIEKLPLKTKECIARNGEDLFATILGKFAPGVDPDNMFQFLRITCIYVSQMHRRIIRGRDGIG